MLVAGIEELRPLLDRREIIAAIEDALIAHDLTGLGVQALAIAEYCSVAVPSRRSALSAGFV